MARVSAYSSQRKKRLYSQGRERVRALVVLSASPTGSRGEAGRQVAAALRGASGRSGWSWLVGEIIADQLRGSCTHSDTNARSCAWYTRVRFVESITSSDS